MAGYIRQSTFVDGDTITAALFNNEYNQLVNAFSNTSGHKHDGTTAEGPVIGLIGDAGETSPNNKVLIDTTNNYIEFYVEVSSAPVQQIYIADGAIIPVTDNDIDLGTSSLEFKDIYIDGTATIDTLTVDEAATVGTTLGVTGATTLSSTLGVTGATTLSSTLAVTGATTLSSTLAVTGTSTLTGNVTATNDLSVGGNLTVTGNATISGNLTFGDADTDSINLSAEIDSNIVPNTDDTYDLGTTTKQWRNLYIDGTAEIDTLAINGTTVTSTAAELNILDGVTSTAAELNILDGVTSTTAELNILDGVTATAAEINLLDGVTSTTAELNILDGVTANATEINLLDGVTATTAELNILDGVTSNATELNLLDGITEIDTDISTVAATDTTLASAKAIKTYVDSQVTAQDLDFQGDTGGALSIDLDSESLTIAGGTGLDTVGSGNTVTVNIDSTVATLTGTQTLTNKTLTSPDVNTPDIDGGTIDGTAIGGATPAAGTFTTLTANTSITGTLATAAQPNITSLGTLTSLVVDDITINGSNITDSGDIYIDVGGDIHLNADGGDIKLEDDTIEFGRISNSASSLQIYAPVQDKDINFLGNDGGSTITALSLDMSAAGKATFNAGAVFSDAVLVGKSSENAAIAGTILNETGDTYITAEGSQARVLYLNRLTSDGNIIDLRKDGTAIGTIGAYNSATAILSGAAGSYSGLYLNTDKIEPVGNDFGSEIRANNTIDIGSSTYKFKDLHLSGAAYTNGITTTGNLVIGAEDNNSAILEISGGATGSTEGGEIRIDLAADHDTTYEFYRIDVNQDDFRIGRQGNTDLYIFQDGKVKVENTFEVGGAVTFNDGISIEAGKLTINEFTGGSAYTQIRKTNAGSNLAVVSQESIYMLLDENNDQTNRGFYVEHGSGEPGAGTTVFNVSESGDANLYGDLLLDASNAEINIKSGVGGTSGAINWTFNTDSTEFASIKLPYDTRASTGLHIDSGYPITIDASASGDYAIDFRIGGTLEHRFNTTGVVFNELSADRDFRVESNNKSHMLFIDGGNDRIGMNTSSPTHTLHIKNEVSSDTIDENNGLVKMQSSGGNGMIFGTIASSPFSSYIQSAYVTDTSLAQYNLALNPIGGNVGIGLTNPSDKLEIYKGISYNADSALFSRIGVNADAVNNNAVHAWRTGISGGATGHSYTLSTLGRTESSFIQRASFTPGGNLEFNAYTTNPSFGNVSISIPDRQASLYNVGDRGNITIQASSATTGSQAMSGGRLLLNAGNSNNGQTGDIILSTGVNIINSADKGAVRFNIGGRTSSQEVARITGDGITFNGDTAAANALDDYEEGTFSGTQEGSTYSGTYTKVGRICHISITIDNSSSTGTRMAALPFSPKNGGTAFNGTQPTFNTSSSLNDTYIAPYNGGTIVYLYSKSGSTQNVSTGTITANWVYETD